MTTNRSTTAALLAAMLTALVGVVPSASAVVPDPQPVTPFVPGIDEDPELAGAWQKWQAKGIDDYVLTVRLSCFCVPADAVRTVIRNDRIRRVTQGDKQLRPGRGYSMDELFTMIREASVEADRVEVEHTRRGVPTSITIDPDEMVADEESYYTVTLSRLG
jgi:hypothetical protein